MLRNCFTAIVGGIVLLCFFCSNSIAQTEPESSYIANLNDTRFKDVVEDMTSPTLEKSTLKPVPPMIGIVNEGSGYSISLIRVQWRRADPIDLWLMKPTGVKKPPVIIYLNGFPTDTDFFKDPSFQQLSTQGGFAAVGFVTALTGHRYHDIGLNKWFVSELQQSLAESAHDVQMVLNYLASRGDLDMDRVGLFGQFSGATVGVLAAAADPRIKVLDALDPWGDWPTWMGKSPFVPDKERPNFIKPEFLSKAATLEPLDWIPKVQSKKIRLLQRTYEGETPLESKMKLQAAVPAGATTVLYKTSDEFNKANAEHAEKALHWIKSALQSLPPAEAVPAAGSAVAEKKSN